MPLDALHHVRKMRGGAQAHLLQCSDGNAYVVKFQNNPQHRRILVNELIAAAILKHLQIAAPETALIQTDEGFLARNPEVRLELGSQKIAPKPGWHFGSRYPGHPERTATYDYLPDSLLQQVANPRDFLGVLVFDKWTANTDGRQAIFFRAKLKDWLGETAGQRAGFVALMIDHGFTFNGPHWDFPESSIYGLYPRRSVYANVTSAESFEPWLQRVKHFPEKVLDDAWKSIPPEWIDGDESHLERMLETLMRRRARIQHLIEDACFSSGRPFPNWQA